MNRREVVAALAAVGLAACGGNTRDTAPPPTTGLPAPPVTRRAAAPTTTNAPPTTAAATTTSTATSTSTTTPATSTTVVEALPIPEAPPADARAPEPEFVVGTIEIPKIGVAKTMYAGITLTTLDRGPGYWPGTAMPGHRGNTVVGGHRTSKDKPFRHIDQLTADDEVIFTTPEGRFVYRVTSTEIVTPDAMWIVDQTDGFTATLFACHPVGSTRERIVVHLQLAA
jgi:sortase A